ncbi:hypothetical protein V6N12_009476 [Hibiscus sabdariffa]|uniref:Testicular haploid expressed gene protein-like n=1 Tax=Hibiscus sabdariffa TaxID=183260 RepID=A0ABR2E991_9ROSI
MAYPRDFKKAIIHVIKDKFPESSMRSQCLNRNLPTSLPWHHIPTRQKLDAKEEYRQSLYKTEKKITQLRLVDSRNPVEPRITRRGHIFPLKGRKQSGRFNARLGAVLKQFQVDDIQNPPGQQLWHRPGQSCPDFPAEAEDFPPRPKIFRQAKAAKCPARTANQSPAEIPTEAGLDKKYKVEDKLITQHDALPNSEDQPRYLPGQDPLPLPRHPLCHPIKADY